MNQSGKNFDGSFVPYSQSAKVLKPGVGPLDNPSVFVPPQLPSILVSRNCIVSTRRDDRLDAALDQQCSEFVTVIGSISDQSLRFALSALAGFHFDVVQGGLCQFHFRRGSLLHVYSERSTRAIGQYHELCSLAAFSLPDHGAPFLARMNIPSIKHSSHLTFCSSESWFKKARHRFRRTSFSAHSLSLRLTVLLVPYFSGNSLQGAPVHKIQSMPSKHFRSSAGGRPPFRLGRRFGNCSLTSSHCLSVNDRQAMVTLPGLVNYRSNLTCQPDLR